MKETTLDVDGMTCRSCGVRIDRALQAVDGVEATDVRLREGRVLVRHDDTVEAEALVGAVTDAGYGARKAS